MLTTYTDAENIGKILNIDWNVVPVETFKKALDVELEHTDITKGDLLMTGRIALAHLTEDPYYYTRLAKSEREADVYWSRHKKPSPVTSMDVKSAVYKYFTFRLITVWLIIAIVVITFIVLVFKTDPNEFS